jgi:hypothetical protein
MVCNLISAGKIGVLVSKLLFDFSEKSQIQRFNPFRKLII